MIALKLVLGWQSSRSWTSRQAKGGRVAAQSDPLCPTSRGQLFFSRGAPHLTPLNPGSWPGGKSRRRMNPHNTHCSAGWCLQYAPALQYRDTECRVRTISEFLLGGYDHALCLFYIYDHSVACVNDFSSFLYVSVQLNTKAQWKRKMPL